MALIKKDKFDRIQKQKNSIHDETYCTYTIFVEESQKYFQLDTYGSSNRKIPDKVSQSIQLDKQSAAKLVELLKTEFGF